MKGIRISRNRVNYFILPIVFSMFSIISGCMPGTIETAVGTGIIYEQKQRYAYQHEVEAKVDEYIRDHADSPCRNGEDRVIDSAVEIIKTYRLSGFNEVLERLDTLYRDPAQPEGVRAAALYNMAVLHSRRGGENTVLAREYFKRLYVEFPNHYRCIFADTEWRDAMIRKQLLLPGETVEEFLEDARRDVERWDSEGGAAE